MNLSVHHAFLSIQRSDISLPYIHISFYYTKFPPVVTSFKSLTSDTLNCENWITITECFICNEPIVDETKEKVLCKYCFNCKGGINCTSCIQKMLEKGNFNCPFCRKEIDKTQIQGQGQTHVPGDIQVWHVEFLSSSPKCVQIGYIGYTDTTGVQIDMPKSVNKQIHDILGRLLYTGTGTAMVSYSN